MISGMVCLYVVVSSCKGALIDIRLARIFMLEFQLGSVNGVLCGCLCVVRLCVFG